MDITKKSIGMLIDEYLTTLMKIEVNPSQENISRAKLLESVIRPILHQNNEDVLENIAELTDQLRVVLRECWNSQEIVMNNQNLRYPDQITSMTMIPFFRVYEAAINAQKTNAARNKLIREIDRILGNGNITALEKTYA